MNRRGFIGALLSAPVAMKVARLPVLLDQTPKAAVRRAAGAYWDGKCWKVYDNDGRLRVQLGVF